MLITTEIFRAFLNCETKSYLKSSGNVGPQRGLIEWERSRLDDFKQKCLVKLRANFEENARLAGISSLQALENSKYSLIIDCVLQAQGLQSQVHALERLIPSVNRKHNTLIPSRCLPNEKITKYDKLLVAFDALVLFTAFSEMPLFGKIIHGSEQKTVKIKLASLMEMTKAAVNKIAAQQISNTPPQLILNKHCLSVNFNRDAGR